MRCDECGKIIGLEALKTGEEKFYTIQAHRRRIVETKKRMKEWTETSPMEYNFCSFSCLKKLIMGADRL